MSSSPSPSSLITIKLALKPGFCIKSSTLAGALLSPSSQPAAKPLPVPEGLKVFVNIAWDPNAPPSPKGSEEAIQHAIQGEDVEDDTSYGLYIPAIVSNAREDKDKSGNPSLVFDCIYNSTVKSRVQRDPEFKLFLIELSLQRIEAQTGLVLSRDIRTPNISSKGKLLPRTAQFTESTEQRSALQERSGPDDNVAASSESSTTGKGEANVTTLASKEEDRTATIPLDWSWTKDDVGRLRIEVHVPGLTYSLVQRSSLYIEPRRITLSVPNRCTLDINVALSDAEIASGTRLKDEGADERQSEKRREDQTMRTLQLKRERDFEVDGAEAEWKVGSGTVVVYL
ncbi:pre-RNA processing PIH1/Nop17-domain-containing protein [Flammula alnicola]|nr:pre-RNA processing PIH1/Nop17-domain-containing protein [Flammula alnicola]